MKKTYRYFAAAVALIAAVSCTKQEEMTPQLGNNPDGTYEYILKVNHENDNTKTSMDGVQILWNADDQIGVTGSYLKDGQKVYGDAKVFGEAKSIVDAESYQPSTSATFNLALPDEGYIPQAIVYPYFAKAKITGGASVNNGTICNVKIPEIQTGIEGNIPNGAMAMTGFIASNNECTMRNCGAVIQFKFTREDVVSLKFESNNSEKLAGESYHYIKVHKDDEVNKVGDVCKEKPIEGSSSVTLVPSGATFEAGVYYFVVAPADLTEGFSITLTAQDGTQATRRTSAPFKIERNHKYTNFGSDDWFRKISTAAAGNLGSADGKTATLYAVVSGADIADGDEYGFETSTDGVTWVKYTGTVSRRTSTFATYNVVNVLTSSLTDLVPETTYYYRAYYTNSIGVTTYGASKSFMTYAKAESAIIDLYNGFDTNYWPFNNVAYDADIKKGTSGDAAFKGKEGKEVDLTTTSGYAFTAKATDGVWLGNSNGCFTMKVSTGDYIKFPVVDGKKPVAVTMVIGGKNGNVQGLPSIAEFGVEATSVSGQWDGTDAATYDSHTWNVTTTAGKQYGIYFNGKNNFYLSYLEVVYVDADVVVKPAKIEQNLVFSTRVGGEGGAVSWPFAQSQGASNAVSTNVGPFTSFEHPDVSYSFYVSGLPTESSADDKWRTTAGQGFRFGGAAGDYMEFGAVEGYKLTYLKIRGGTKTVKYSIQDTSGSIICTEASISKTADSTLEFYPQTEAGKAYRLVLGDKEPSAIREMWITYELVK